MLNDSNDSFCNYLFMILKLFAEKNFNSYMRKKWVYNDIRSLQNLKESLN